MGDLVLRKAGVSDPRHSRGKLAPRWEGLYCIIRDETFTLTIMEGKILPRTWHVLNLNFFFLSKDELKTQNA
ncbi:hypothetical protein B296_00033713 [Ensete ventricosum]|uniref:Uncharacterized protein n=1 Tax=Ensete ventricosum TaxID=4639 RepID=A0A427A944_ENSVE|nr:hypothetical protein B296_00033713 [Ensete ventricosum]